MGFEELEFVDEPVDKNLTCIICLSVMKAPTTICPNGHTCCADCIAIAQAQDHHECPECRERLLENKVLNRPLQSIIMGLRVKCPNMRDVYVDKSKNNNPKRTSRSGDACSWVGTLSDFLVSHNKEGGCEFVNIKCICCGMRVFKVDWEEHQKTECRRPCTMCGAIIQSSQIDHHTKNQCPYRVIQCSLCNLKVMACGWNLHVEKVCPNKLVTCIWCQSTMPRKEVGTAVRDEQQENQYFCTGHLAQCAHMEVFCEYHALGCTAHQMKRMDLPKHHRDSVDYHVRLLGPALRNLQDGCQWIQKTVQWDIGPQKLPHVLSGVGVESETIPVGAICSVNFKLLQGLDGSIEAKFCTHASKWKTTSAPIVVDKVVFESLWGDHVCRLEGERTMEVDPDNRNLWCIAGTLQLEVRNNEGATTYRACRYEDLIQTTDQDRVYSLEVQFRLRAAPTKSVISCV
ncbi:E3 ubiquitin ligase that [Seminavis robusta]|uniref:E3 ubiquitin ligase that n=1 Tax=Seminavis robusta TaxID=568900 RepID=A0A9N8EQY4_9STRA|nr:E3 ubiquitin ligase that [Seminavis robusta]|eukprot:Sro1443_g273140.1 E3 ubiquitin ligase that (457) ;mRNA; r:6438-7808